MSLSCGPRTPYMPRMERFFLLLLTGQALLCHFHQPAAAVVGLQEANMTLEARDWSQDSAVLDTSVKVVTSTVCGLINSTEEISIPNGWCVAFLTPMAPGKLTLNIHAETSNVRDFVTVSDTFRYWVGDDSKDLMDRITEAVNRELGVQYSTLSKLSGVYSSPCRSSKVNEMLPLCNSTRNCKTVLSFEGLKSNVTEFLCARVPKPCEKHVQTEEVWGGNVEIIIEGVKNSMEIAIDLVAEVREGNFSAERIELLQDERAAQLFASNELKMYDYPLIDEKKCASGNDLWLLLIAVPLILLLFSFRYIFGIGRRSGKHIERNAIIDDEVHGQQMGTACLPGQFQEFMYVDPQQLNGCEGNEFIQEADQILENQYTPQFTPACAEGDGETASCPGEEHTEDNAIYEYGTEQQFGAGGDRADHV
ncbi:hypothetical protein, conserved [Trypanosoma brucei brucei TREU927]|uniref:Uncharacterized protein n=1 Tax=Trypanosoma brucei brucei (strain 927/4 GUTat10.1) TaxID=185431 RepID=Q586B9_TRYB2|nr:hypothetical protein, conserved [Trypanosoma brucei brucei TREU927]AAQ16054.1 hypothetical protein, conserved [Trypanosoma brucei brucei TREU927]AAX79013.1 hypothetical protein, conserved [Trypanosoma brucei]